MWFYVLLFALLVALVVIFGVLRLFIAVHHNVGVAPPTEDQKKQDLDKSPLFRHLPELKEELAWVDIGMYPTPIHRGHIEIPGKGDFEFYVKREDLSSNAYGGNKVRTLQHQLGVVQARMERENNLKKLVVLGSAGSNQILATVVHGFRGLGIPTFAGWFDEDKPDFDNTLNMLSCLSFRNLKYSTFGNKLTILKNVMQAVWSKQAIVLPPGGNNPSGVLGQMGGPLEISEQITQGEMPDPDAIYVAMGSSCTITGLIMGVALVKYVNMPAFKKQGFKIHGLPIHHGFVGLQKRIGFYNRDFSKNIPLSILHSIHSTCKTLRDDLRGPDLLEISLFVFHNMCVIHDEVDIVGTYGGHSDKSRAAADLFDRKGKLTDIYGEDGGKMWLCGHFSAKSYNVMLQDMEKIENKDKTFLFWETKSAVQPRSDDDEWIKFQREPKMVHKWANEGKAESSLREGKVDTENGTADDYRKIMTDVTGSATK